MTYTEYAILIILFLSLPLFGSNRYKTSYISELIIIAQIIIVVAIIMGIAKIIYLANQ